MNSETRVKTSASQTPNLNQKHLKRVKIFGVLLTIIGISLFSYFVYSVGVNEIIGGIKKIGFGGFALIIFIYFLRISCRASAWRLSVYEPYKLRFSDALSAVMIGEAVSSIIPLGVIVSGTSKAVAVRNRLPLVVGFSSIATENLFYSLITGIFISFGAITFLRNSQLPEGWVLIIDTLIFLVFLLISFGFFIVYRQLHLISNFCNWLYNRRIGRSILENGRAQARLFEDLIFGFYRKYPRRFLPICLFEIIFHALGVTEILFILSRISESFPSLYAAFLLESMSRVITVVFKLVPFLIGIDEAGAKFITETLALGAGIGITLAIIRKGRILFWTAVGLLLIVRRGLSLKEIRNFNP
ncbi:MAG: lysylphosphatidylglycerol synthase domain-containing protein, partial [Pyrinomonadaceae bacterium]